MKTNKSKNFHVLLQTGFVANWQIVGEPFDPIYYHFSPQAGWTQIRQATHLTNAKHE